MKNVPFLPINTALPGLHALPTLWDKAFYSFLAATGHRASDALRLDLDDIDIDVAK